ncbi:MAG: repeat protein [Acidobacteria bacterium]|nr:repeat protein [Acidobacteriota bacterium]
MTSQPQRRSPYQGLIPYTENDADFFFGREKDTRLIIANLFASQLTLLYGVSGVGKSSVLRAGVVNRLRSRADVLIVAFNTWQGEPLRDLKIKIASVALAASPQAVAPSTSLALAEYLEQWSQTLSRRILILLDQFEEYFLYHPQGDSFSDEWPATFHTAAPLSFLISIREDGYAKLDFFEGRVPGLYDNNLRIEHLDHPAARSAIENPLLKFNELYRPQGPQVEIEPELVNEILKQVEEGRVVLSFAGQGVVKRENTSRRPIETPYLQLVLTRLWNEEERLGSNTLRLATFNKLGGARKIIQSHLGEVMRGFSGAQRRMASRCFKHLVTPSGTKIAMSAIDLADYAHLSSKKVKRIEAILQKLAGPDVRLLRSVDAAEEHGETRYEIFHDALAPGVLEWLARYRKSQQRAVLALMFLIFAILLAIPVMYFFAVRTHEESLSTNLGCLSAVSIIIAIVFIIPLSIGFSIGVLWARAR